MLGAAAVAVLAAATLSACRTNVGNAATIDGHRVSESDVGSYLTPKAQAVAEQDSSGGSLNVPARSFVLETIIVDRLLARIVDALPGDPPTKGALAKIRQQGLAGSSESAVAKKSGVIGFTAAFNTVWVHSKILNTVLGNAQQQGGIDVRTLAAKTRFPVSVNPRYGTWDRATFSLLSGSDAGLPDFLKLQPSHPPAASGTPAPPK